MNVTKNEYCPEGYLYPRGRETLLTWAFDGIVIGVMDRLVLKKPV
jgi:hypothetical protein